MSFWYHMYGPHVDAFNIYIQTARGRVPPRWSRFGTQGNQWQQGELTIKHKVDVQVRCPYKGLTTH